MTYRLVIVGGGRMGSALAEGLRNASWCAPEELCVSVRRAESIPALAERLEGVAISVGLPTEGVDASTGAVICVKPDYAESVATQLAAAKFTRVLSVVAGLSCARLEAAFPGPVAVVRSMPNTPVLIGRGVTAIAGGSRVTSDDLAWAESILSAVGTVVRVTERQIDAVTGLSGPMPAYLYLVIEALIEAGVHQGLAHDVSRQLVVDSFVGSALLLAETGLSPEELRAQVTSPGGTTAAGLRVLESRAVRSAFLETVAAAAERSRQMGR
ncbi:MAG TPA: pyrroline-5-carboxylate reductase [Acidimicrobiales bacterium]|jgi:pyrroline-5-carboxylate reductase